jgi:hypothetical protein
MRDTPQCLKSSANYERHQNLFFQNFSIFINSIPCSSGISLSCDVYDPYTTRNRGRYFRAILKQWVDRSRKWEISFPFPGLDMGIIETNGHLNYLNWKKMLTHHPRNGAPGDNRNKGSLNLTLNFTKQVAEYLNQYHITKKCLASSRDIEIQ